LFQSIIDLSEADEWNQAKAEWNLARIYFEEGGTCLCGHWPISQHCVIRNRVNGNEVILGSCCVKHFLDLPADRFFHSLRRVAADLNRSLHKEIVSQAYEEGWINDWELGFYLDTIRRRRLSSKQKAKRAEINRLILEHTNVLELKEVCDE
jgi:hypothetical protein